MRTEIFADQPEMDSRAAGFIIRRAARAVERRGRFALALAGGRTPLGVYGLLQDLPWERSHFFWGDERCGPKEHARSNYRAALAALNPPADLPRANLHRIQAELGPRRGAEFYTRRLREFFGPDGAPVFDLILLGLGADGHTASLFPGDAALTSQALVLGVEPPEWVTPRLPRVSLGLAVLNAARSVLFLVSGAAKAGAVRSILEAAPQAAEAPGALVRPAGELVWFLDAAAAGQLSRRPGASPCESCHSNSHDEGD